VTTYHSLRIPGDFDGNVWVVDGRVIDPLNRDRFGHTELEVVGVCLHAWGRTLDIPIRAIPDAVLDFFTVELNGDYESQNDDYSDGAYEHHL